MDNQSEVIQQQMEETRSNLQDKLETLEEQVKNTVQDATDAVSETVESVKEAVQGTVETVKDTVQDTVTSVKNTFDLPRQVEAHPWAMFLGAAALGFVATRWLSQKPTPVRAAAQTMPPPDSAPSRPPQNVRSEFGNGHHGASRPSSPPPSPEAASGNWLTKHYAEEIDKVKGLAVGALGAVVRDLLTSAVAPAIGEQVKDVINGFTEKMGGHVMKEPILPGAEDAAMSASSGKSGATADAPGWARARQM